MVDATTEKPDYARTPTAFERKGIVGQVAKMTPEEQDAERRRFEGGRVPGQIKVGTKELAEKRGKPADEFRKSVREQTEETIRQSQTAAAVQEEIKPAEKEKEIEEPAYNQGEFVEKIPRASRFQSVLDWAEAKLGFKKPEPPKSVLKRLQQEPRGEKLQ